MWELACAWKSDLNVRCNECLLLSGLTMAGCRLQRTMPAVLSRKWKPLWGLPRPRRWSSMSSSVCSKHRGCSQIIQTYHLTITSVLFQWVITWTGHGRSLTRSPPKKRKKVTIIRLLWRESCMRIRQLWTPPATFIWEQYSPLLSGSSYLC